MNDLLALGEMSAQRDLYARHIAELVTMGQSVPDDLADCYRHYRDAWRSASDCAAALERRA
jgi:hypothetical protein